MSIYNISIIHWIKIDYELLKMITMDSYGTVQCVNVRDKYFKLSVYHETSSKPFHKHLLC